MVATIQLNFFGKNVDKFEYKLLFHKKKHKITNNKISYDIPETIFKHGKDKAVISITLYLKGTKNFGTHKFYVYYSNNKVNIMLNYITKHTYEIIVLKKNNMKFSHEEIEYPELDTMGNNKFQRLVLINYEFTDISINDKLYDLQNIIINNCKDIVTDSYQLNELDLENKKFIVKPIKEKEDFDVDFFKNKNEKIISFEEELNNLFELEENKYNDKLDEIEKNYSDIRNHKSVYFNRIDEYLLKLFEENKFLNENLFYNYFLCIFFLDNKKYFKDYRYAMKTFLENIELVKEKIVLNEEVEIPEKIRAINALFLTTNEFSSLDKIKLLRLKAFVIDEKQRGSIMDKAFTFLNKLIETLNYDSVVFSNLLYLDGGYGLYENEVVYCYDLSNLEMIKSHLRLSLPKIIIFYYAENEDKAYFAPEFGGICVNEYQFFKKDITKSKLIDYNGTISFIPKMEDEDDVAMDLAIFLIHESFGHKKFNYAENGVQSPKKIINKKNKLIKLKYKRDIKESIDDEDEYILELNNNQGDSGHFLELAYGKFENDLIIKLLLDMKKKGKLLKRADLFTDSGEKLKEYISLRKSAENEKINFKFDENTSIEEEIKEMKKIIILENGKNDDKIKSKSEEDFKKIENINLQKKTKRDETDIDINELLDNSKNKKVKLSEEDNTKIENDTNLEKSPYELMNVYSYNEVRKIVEKRITQKFGFKIDSFVQKKITNELKKLSPGDNYYYDLVFLNSQYNKKI